jgi:hypothetical protein
MKFSLLLVSLLAFAQDKPPDPDKDLQIKALLLVIDVNAKVTAAEAAAKARDAALAELTKACGEAFNLVNDMTGFHCQAKPKPIPEK